MKKYFVLLVAFVITMSMCISLVAWIGTLQGMNYEHPSREEVKMAKRVTVRMRQCESCHRRESLP